jgi:hypothetical protein
MFTGLVIVVVFAVAGAYITKRWRAGHARTAGASTRRTRPC